MKKLIFMFLAAGALSFTACSSDDDDNWDDNNNGGNGGGSNTTATFDYEVTGDDQASRNGAAYFEEDGDEINVILTSSTDGFSNVSFNFKNPIDEKTYSEVTDVVFDGLGDDEVAVNYSNGSKVFGGTSGSVEITEVSATHIHGSFDVDVKYEPFDGGDTLTANIQGTFIADED